MRKVLVLASVAMLAAAGASVAATRLALLPPAAPAGQIVYFGHVRSLARHGSRWELRFDPSLLLSGVTGERAAVADGAIPAGQPVPNDNYERDEGHRLLTFLVAPSARVRLVARGLGTLTVPVAEYAEILRGRNPRHRALFDPGNHLGAWIRVRIDTIRELDQQYHP